MSKPCDKYYDAVETSARAYENALNDALAAINRAGEKLSLAAGICGISYLVPFAPIGCAALAANAVFSLKDFYRADKKSDAAEETFNDAHKAYQDCLNNHKWFYP